MINLTIGKIVKDIKTKKIVVIASSETYNGGLVEVYPVKKNGVPMFDKRYGIHKDYLAEL